MQARVGRINRGSSKRAPTFQLLSEQGNAEVAPTGCSGDRSSCLVKSDKISTGKNRGRMAAHLASR